MMPMPTRPLPLPPPLRVPLPRLPRPSCIPWNCAPPSGPCSGATSSNGPKPSISSISLTSKIVCASTFPRWRSETLAEQEATLLLLLPKTAPPLDQTALLRPRVDPAPPLGPGHRHHRRRHRRIAKAPRRRRRAVASTKWWRFWWTGRTRRRRCVRDSCSWNAWPRPNPSFICLPPANACCCISFRRSGRAVKWWSSGQVVLVVAEEEARWWRRR